MSAIADFQNARVLVLGDVMLDRYWWGTVNRISPEAPVPVINLERTTSKPGGAANVALNCSSLGAAVIILSAVGSDEAGDELIGALQSMGLGTGGILRIPNRRTSVKTRIIAHNQQVTRVDSEQVEELDYDASGRLEEAVTRSLKDTDVVIVSDYAKGTLNEALLRAVIDAAAAESKPVLVDPKGKDYSRYRAATVLTPNRREAAEACKLDEAAPDIVARSGEALLFEVELQHVLITEGEHGMTLFSKEVPPIHWDAAVHQVYDVTGAGDSVIACLGVALAAGRTMRDACGLANLAGGISVRHVGAHAVTLSELSEELALADAHR